MIADAVKCAKRCKACQIHADFRHQPPELLHHSHIMTNRSLGNWCNRINQSSIS